MENYRCKKGVIGAGGFGQVTAAVRRDNGTRVAIKWIKKTMVKRWSNLRVPCLRHSCGYAIIKVPEEVAVLLQVRGVTGAIEFIDYFEYNGYACIVMERPKNAVTLLAYVNKYGALKEDVACHIYGQVVETICRLEHVGIVHRDIKEENILIQPDTMRVWIIDFGMADKVGRGLTTEFRGSVINQPPEYLTGKRYYPEEGDVWAVGTSLMRMMTNTEWFTEYDDIVNAPIKFPHGISRNCRQFFMQALCRDPVKRCSIDQLASSRWIHGWVQSIACSK